MAGGGRFRELLKKYGKVALGVHFSVSAVSITGLYLAIKNNVDVESMLEKVYINGALSKNHDDGQITKLPQTNLPENTTDHGFVLEDESVESKAMVKKNRTAELAASSGGALALAVLVNKALFPVRVPITLGLTPPIARFLARRRIIKNSGLVD